MIRLLLTWVGIAALQLGTPHATSAAELVQPTSARATAVPRTQAPQKGVISREATRADRAKASRLTPFAPTALPRGVRALASAQSNTNEPKRSAPASLPRVLPDARAPPA